MKTKLARTLIFVCVAIDMTGAAYANGFSLQFQGGPAWPLFQNSTQDVEVYTNTVNQYTITAPAQNKALLGSGINYQWDYHTASFNLGLHGYYTRSTVAGINSPSINGGNFDTLTYSANDTSYALMLEPKLILTAYAWQPYLLAGAGISTNHVDNYHEYPTDPNGTAIATTTPFNSKTTRNFAYEGGIGVQHAIVAGKNPPVIALDYRRMDWGKAELSTYDGQPGDSTLKFGHMYTTSANLSLIVPF